jgi:hypothetical protein
MVRRKLDKGKVIEQSMELKVVKNTTRKNIEDKDNG